ncbi:ATP-binding protein [Streptomyces sp. ISL-86]|uniref:ATP-binding protein n=1 Tax=unclassified Streptomyces TaxID=2593676 RepID=UPI0035A876B8
MSESARSRGQIRRLGLYGASSVVGRCRDFCRGVLEDWAWPGPSDLTGLTEEEREAAVDDVLLLVSEAVTNANLHAGGPTELVLRLSPADPHTPGRSGDLSIEVSDGSQELPKLRTRGAAELPGGHGLMVMNRLARRWGVTPREAGKSVWFEVAAPVPAGARRAPAAAGQVGSASPHPGHSPGGPYAGGPPEAARGS